MIDSAVVRIPVPFTGARSGSGPLTHGQRNTLNWVGKQADEFSAVLPWTFVLPDGVTFADIAESLAVLMARHETLRTTYVTDGEPTQHVRGSGELTVEIRRLTDEQAATDDERLAAELVAVLRAQGVDFRTELPLRVAVAIHRDVPRVAVVVYSHMAVDFGSIALIGRQFTELAADPAARVVGEPVHQPLDQAELEGSARGVRTADAALRYWEAHLRSAPQAMYPVPAPTERPTDAMRVAFMQSYAGGMALDHITMRTRTSRQVVVLAAVCAVLAHRTGVSRCVFAAVSGNRFRLRLREYVGTLAQDGLLALDVTDPTFDELVARAARATLAANNNSMFDATKLWRIIDQVCHERGTSFTRDFTLNDITTHMGGVMSRAPGEGPGDPAAVTAALADTAVRWLDADRFPVVLMCNPARLSPDLVLALTTDTHYVSEAETETLLLGVEGLLVAAASGNVPLDRIGAVSGVAPVVRGPDWVCVDSCWVRLPAVAALVADALPVPASHVVVDGDRLVAYLTATDALRDPTDAHAACMTLLREPPRYTAMAPGHYVLCDGTPTDPTDVTAWRALPVVAEGDGRIKQPG